MSKLKRPNKRPAPPTERTPVRGQREAETALPAGAELTQVPAGGSHALRAGTAQRLQSTRGNAFLQRMLDPLGPDIQLLQRQGTDFDDIQGDPTARPDPGTIIHPTLRNGSRGPGVEELQQKLNADGADPQLAVDGIFGPLTTAAVRAFQSKNTLQVDGIVGPETWGKIDDLGLASTVGRVEREWSEEVGGQTYGMTSRYTWRINPGEIRIIVKLKFTGVSNPGAVSGMFTHIRSIWNRFKAVNTGTNEEYNVVFDPQSVSSGQDNVVRLRSGNGRSDAANWYLGDPDLNNTAAHEFGHMVGLEDEYQRGHTDYQRLTGEAPDTGQQAGPGATAPATVAQELHDALRVANVQQRVQDSNAVISNHSLQQGEYAQQIAAAYSTAYGIGLVQDIVDRIPDQNEWGIVDPFTHSSQSIMGMGGNHQHPVEPRHVREFVGYVKQAHPGDYEVQSV